MATANPFDLLGDDENDDPSQLIAAHQQKAAAMKLAAPAAPAPAAAAKLPSRPLPPALAVRESRNNTAPVRDGYGRGGPGRGRGERGTGLGQNRDFGNGNERGTGHGQNRDFGNGNGNRYGGGGEGGGGSHGGAAPEDGEAGKPLKRERGSYGPPRGGRRGGFVDGSAEGGFDPDLPQRRIYERRSGTGRGYGMKREGAGRGNWGTVTDDALAQETEESVKLDDKPVAPEKQMEQQDVQGADASKVEEKPANQAEEKEPEDSEMTLEEYEKIKEEKRKALLAMKVEERKVELDKDFESMQQLTVKKGNDDVFIKLGSDKELSKRRENAEKEERAKKALSINEFLKPAEGERYYSPSGRGRGGGRGERGSFRGGYGNEASISPAAPAPSIADQVQFPTLRAK